MTSETRESRFGTLRTIFAPRRDVQFCRLRLHVEQRLRPILRIGDDQSSVDVKVQLGMRRPSGFVDPGGGRCPMATNRC